MLRVLLRIPLSPLPLRPLHSLRIFSSSPLLSRPLPSPFKVSSLHKFPSLPMSSSPSPSLPLPLETFTRMVPSSLNSTNPLLQTFSVPPFEKITPKVIDEAVKTLLNVLSDDFTTFENALSSPSYVPSFSSIVFPFFSINDRLEFVFGIAKHLENVKDNKELRETMKELQPLKVKFDLRITQSKPMYDALSALQKSSQWSSLPAEEKRIVDRLVLDAKLQGVGLQGEEKKRFNEIKEKLSDIGTTFRNNVTDAIGRWSLLLTSEDEVKGLPMGFREGAAASAKENSAKHPEWPESAKTATGEKGPWEVTLSQPSYIPFMKSSERRDLREKVYREIVTMASKGDIDNQPIIAEFLQLRSEMSSLLGYSNYAEVSLSTKMASSVSAVNKFLEDLRVASYDGAVDDLKELKSFAQEESKGEYSDIQLWDVAFWVEKLKKKRFDFNDEELKSYFQFPVVLKGLFDLFSDLYGIEFRDATSTASLWDPEVKFFTVHKDGQHIASFYADCYARPGEKNAGAWMDVLQDRAVHPDGSVRLPIAYIVCNQEKSPDASKPSLMTWLSVQTLFHEMGHCVQCLLTRQSLSPVCGIRMVEWDAVELPSQFMENFCDVRPVLNKIAKHVETGETLSDELFGKLQKSKTFRSASDSLRQISFGMTDMAIYSQLNGLTKKSKSEIISEVFALEAEILQKTTVIPPLPEQKFLCSFQHIMNGGYSAGYYSYKWAEVMDADAFAAFEEAGALENPTKLREMGEKFASTVLGLGGSLPAGEVYRKFRGRDPSVNALLKREGLLKS